MKFLEELKKLNLPADKFAVFGSGPMAIRGLRENNDLDVVVKPEVWKELLKKHKPVREDLIAIGKIHLFKHWEPWFPDLDKLIDTADVIDGIRFVKLEHVIEWKKKRNTEQDRKDIEIIEKYLMNAPAEI